MRVFVAAAAFLLISHFNLQTTSHPVNPSSSTLSSSSSSSDSFSTRTLEPSIWTRPNSPTSIVITATPSSYAINLGILLIDAWHIIQGRMTLVGAYTAETEFNWLGANDLILRIQSEEGQELTLRMLLTVIEELYDYQATMKLGGLLASFKIFNDYKRVGQGTIGIL